MGSHSKINPGLFDHLIDAEREALARAGKKVNKIELIKQAKDGLDALDSLADDVR